MLRPRDVGLVERRRRRTQGLRREEVAQLAGMSTDYYARLEQQRAPQPSVQINTALAGALRLSLDEPAQPPGPLPTRCLIYEISPSNLHPPCTVPRRARAARRCAFRP